MTLGELIRSVRKNQGLTLAELGRRMGCSKNYLSGIETGRGALSEDRAREILAHLGHELSTVYCARPIGERALSQAVREK